MNAENEIQGETRGDEQRQGVEKAARFRRRDLPLEPDQVGQVEGGDSEDRIHREDDQETEAPSKRVRVFGDWCRVAHSPHTFPGFLGTSFAASQTLDYGAPV